MTALYDYKQYKVLFVDDEEKTCKYFIKTFEDEFDIIICTSGQEAVEVLKKQGDEIAVLITDQRMPEMTGVQLLDYTLREKPDLIRILSTAYSDLDAAIEAVNKGYIYKYITKPWDLATLEANIRRGMEFFLLKKERDGLMKSKLIGLERLIGLSRIISVAVSSTLDQQASPNYQAGVISLLKLGYAVYDRLDLGYENIFDIKSTDFYDSYIENNEKRLSQLFPSKSELLEAPLAKSQLAEVLGANLDDDNLKGIDFDALSNGLQSIFGFKGGNSEVAKALLTCVVSIAAEGKILSYDSANKEILFIEVQSPQNSLSYLLDDELLLARIAGAL